MTRVLGVLSLRAPMYRDIAKDTTATGQAFVVWLLGTLIAGFFAELVVQESSGLVSTSVPRAVVSAVVALVFGLIGWAFSAWLLAFIAKVIVRGKTNTLEMLRVTGFVHAFDIIAVLSALPLVTSSIGAVGSFISLLVATLVAFLRLIGYLIGVREAAGISTPSAIFAALIAAVVEFLIRVALLALVLGVVLTMVGLAVTGR